MVASILPAFDESDMPVVDYTSFMRCMCAIYQCGYLSLLAAPREDIGRRLREKVEALTPIDHGLELELEVLRP